MSAGESIGPRDYRGKRVIIRLEDVSNAALLPFAETSGGDCSGALASVETLVAQIDREWDPVYPYTLAALCKEHNEQRMEATDCLPAAPRLTGDEFKLDMVRGQVWATLNRLLNAEEFLHWPSTTKGEKKGQHAKGKKRGSKQWYVPMTVLYMLAEAFARGVLNALDDQLEQEYIRLERALRFDDNRDSEPFDDRGPSARELAAPNISVDDADEPRTPWDVDRAALWRAQIEQSRLLFEQLRWKMLHARTKNERAASERTLGDLQLIYDGELDELPENSRKVVTRILKELAAA